MDIKLLKKLPRNKNHKRKMENLSVLIVEVILLLGIQKEKRFFMDVKIGLLVNLPHGQNRLTKNKSLILW